MSSVAHPFRHATAPRFALEYAFRDDNAIVPLRAGVHSIGTSPSAAVPVRGDGVRSRHGTLAVTPGGDVEYQGFLDAAAFVDGRQVRAATLTAGSVLLIGDDALVVHRLEEGEDLTVPSIPGLRGRSAPMRALARTVGRFAKLDLPVLVHGPSGTGKDAVAAAIHGTPGPSSPFVVANVASIPRDLCESELFGHARGAFTGADREHAGLLAQANGGTLFLDEIGELPLDVQPKLLRALDGYGFRPVGGRSVVRPRCRFVTASHVDLRRAVREGAFRNDLLHRLEVLVVRTPSLEARRSDIVAIAYGILTMDGKGMRRKHLTPAAIAQLMRMSWPGNVRELRNLLLRAAAMGRGDAIRAEDIVLAGPNTLADARVDVEATRAVELLEACGGNVTRAANRAGIPRTTFRRRLEEAVRVARSRKGSTRLAGLGASRHPGGYATRNLGRRPSPLAAEVREVLALEVADKADDLLTAE
jgi:transcriptional regulator with AAA-type ATPase domain